MVLPRRPRRRGGKRMPLRRRRVQRKRLAVRSRYADVKSFKLTGYECQVFSTYQSGAPNPLNVSTSGAGLGIANLAIVGGKSSFTGTYVSAFTNTVQFSQLNTLFDRYKIHGVKLTFIPQWSDVDQIGTGIIPVMKIIHDYDDANISDSVNSVNSIWARQGKVVSLRNGRPVSVFLRPKLQQAFNGGSGLTSYGTQKASYLNMTYPNTPHYALKFAVRDWYTPSSATANVRMKVEVVYYVTLREQICGNAPGLTIQVDENGNEVHQNTEIDQQLEFSEDIPCELKPPA